MTQQLSGGSRILAQFRAYLAAQNLSSSTISVYLYAAKQFYQLYPRLTAKNLQLYKVFLLEHYKPQTVNLRIRALNSLTDCRQAGLAPVSMIRVQQKMYLDKIISQADYEYLKRRLREDEDYTWYYLVRLAAATGVRVSELVTFQKRMCWKATRTSVLRAKSCAAYIFHPRSSRSFCSGWAIRPLPAAPCFSTDSALPSLPPASASS